MPGTDSAKPTFKITNPSDGPKLTAAQIAFMKLTEKENLKRLQKLELIRKRNWITGWTLGACVLSIYGYTILTVKQERFLDDFNEPEKVVVAKPE
ncbi:cytochrome c oxidase assembly factor 3, mitochondrial [Sitodiplosis mosellana]|uniref:cytochrome c oxidase assembly factor 3, mitochondrial n=1 Tax=Sitodiplosis mosellana TaxID=263140 RepID=UPI0024449F30|nr:cytochrome c oxidase assembly factor 3, mitochondrial [Sitodiplosis mosellana]